MFGHLLLVVQETVIKYFGQKKWEDVKKKCGIKEDISESKHYDMSLFDKLIKISTEQCGVKENEFHKRMGEVYLSQIQLNGNNQLLRVLGRSFLEFLQNIDFIHTIALGKYPNADIPFFRVDSEVQGPNYIRLHYYSSRRNLSPMVESLLESISKIFFKKMLKIQILEEGQQEEKYHTLYSLDIKNLVDATDTPMFIAQTKKNAEHQIAEKDVTDQKEKIENIRKEYGEAALPVARARLAKSRWKAALKMNILYSRMLPTIPKTLSIGPNDFCTLFPYHIVFDQEMLLKQSGIQIQTIITDFRRIDTNITKYLELIHPKHGKFTFENVENMICCPHVVKTLSNSLTTASNKNKVIHFRGQMMKLIENNYILYMCSPMVSSLNDVEGIGMKMSDIPNHDVTKYFCTFKTIEKGDWSDKFLGNESDSVEENENSNNDFDTYSTMSGSSIMSGLLTNAMREGKKYKNCAILFCDIVQFNAIVTNCGPTEVLEMLNNLHNEFDRLTRVHEVHRIDIVGDAYLVISGIPDNITYRCQRIANMSLAMLLATKSIKSPYDYGQNYGKRALIRIGLNYGDVIGGIIGSTVPKFTVMGESVVTTSKMESHGIPDRIHISAAIYKELASHHFDLEERGCIDIRGKGRQFTYFLNKNIDVSDGALLGKTRDVIYSKK